MHMFLYKKLVCKKPGLRSQKSQEAAKTAITFLRKFSYSNFHYITTFCTKINGSKFRGTPDKSDFC